MTSLASIPPAMIIERPVKKTGQSVAPRHSIVPFHRGGPSSGVTDARTVEWIPSAPISTLNLSSDAKGIIVGILTFLAGIGFGPATGPVRSEEHTSELQSRQY